MNDIFLNFLWSGKPDEIKRQTVELENMKGRDKYDKFSKFYNFT